MYICYEFCGLLHRALEHDTRHLWETEKFFLGWRSIFFRFGSPCLRWLILVIFQIGALTISYLEEFCFTLVTPWIYDSIRRCHWNVNALLIDDEIKSIEYFHIYWTIDLDENRKSRQMYLNIFDIYRFDIQALINMSAVQIAKLFIWMSS